MCTGRRQSSADVVPQRDGHRPDRGTPSQSFSRLRSPVRRSCLRGAGRTPRADGAVPFANGLRSSLPTTKALVTLDLEIGEVAAAANSRQLEVAASRHWHPGSLSLEVLDGARQEGDNLHVRRMGSEDAQAPAPLFAILPSDALSIGRDRVDLEEGEYSLERLVMLRSVHDPKPALRRESFSVLSVIQDESNATMVHLNSRGPDGEPTNITSVGARALAVRESCRRDVCARFQARPGQANEWVIPPPDELLRALREKLMEEKPN